MPFSFPSLMMAAGKFYSDVFLFCRFSLFPLCFHLPFEFPCLQSVYLWKHSVGWTTEGLGLALNLGTIPCAFISKTSVFKSKKKNKKTKTNVLLSPENQLSLVWSVWTACGKSVGFPVLFIKFCNSPLLNTIYLSWNIAFCRTLYRDKAKQIELVWQKNIKKIESNCSSFSFIMWK